MEAARAGTTKRSLAERRLAWSGVCNSVEYDGLPDASAAQDLCRLVLATLRERSDKKSRAMVERAVDVATRVSSDFRALLAGQVARAAERADKLSPSQRLALVRWSCLIAPRLDLAADAATFAKTAKAAGALLAANATGDDRAAANAAASPFRAMIRRDAGVADALLALLGGEDDPSSLIATAPVAACGLAGETLRACEDAAAALRRVEVARGAEEPGATRRGGEERREARRARSAAADRRSELARRAAMDAYLRVVFAGDARAKRPARFARSLDALTTTLTASEAAETVAPRVAKQMRRSPEATLAPALALLETAPGSVPAGAFEEVFEAVAAQARHADAVRREHAVACVAAVARRARVADDARALFDAILGDVSDAKRRPKEALGRAGLFDAAAALAGVAEATEEAAGEAVAALAAAAKAEANPDANDAALDALGAWLRRHPGPLPPCVSELVLQRVREDAGKDGKALRATRMLSRAFAANRAVARGAAALAPALAPVAKLGATRPGQTREGALALHVIASIAAADDEARAAAERDGVLAADEGSPIGAESLYFNPEHLARLVSPDDAETAAACVGALLASFPDALDAAGSAEPARRAAALMMLHPAPATRRAAEAAIEAAIGAGTPAETLLAALKHWCDAAAEADGSGWPGIGLAAGGARGDEAGAGGGKGPAPFPKRLAGAALAAFCGGGAAGPGRLEAAAAPSVSAALAGPLVLLAHHPSVAAPDGRRGGAWDALLARLDAEALRREAPPLDEVPSMAFRERLAPSMCDAVAGEGGLRSTRAHDRAAARAAAESVAKLDPETALAALLPVAEALGDVAAHAALTPKEVAAFKAPPWRLSTDPSEDVFKYAPPVRSRQKKTGGDDSNSDDDGPAAVSLRPSQLRASQQAHAAAKGSGGKRGATAGAGRAPPKEPDKAALARRARFAEEAETRARVSALSAGLVARLEVTASLMRGGARGGAAARRVPALLGDLLPLLRSPIVPERAGAAFASAATRAAAREVPGNAAMGLAFGGVPESFAAALRLSALDDGGAASDARGNAPSPARVRAESATLEAALEAVDEAAEMNDGEPLPPATLALAFPVCRRALSLPGELAPAHLKRLAVRTLAAHAGAGVEGLPRPALARLALEVVAVGDAAHASAARALAVDAAAGAADADAAAETRLALRRGLVSPYRAVRNAALAALEAGASVDADLAESAFASDAEFRAELLLARHDADDANRESATRVSAAHGDSDSDSLAVPPIDVLPFLSHESAAARDAAVNAFAAAVARNGAAGVAPVLAKLFAAFNAASPKPSLAAAAAGGEDRDASGTAGTSRDPFAADSERGGRGGVLFPGDAAASGPEAAGNAPARAALTKALAAASPSLTALDVPLVSTFLTKALGDEDEAVRDAAMRGGRAMIELHGAEHVRQLLGVYEGYFDRGGGAGLSDARGDFVRRGVAVFLGALACHLERDDPKVRQILKRLVDVLATPSEQVQRSVADCLPPLMPALDEEERRELVEGLLETIARGEGYAARRGAAYGLAGAVKGMGIGSLKLFGIMDRVKLAVEDKTSPEAREGALMAFELLNVRLGRLFEPYVIHVLPMLLARFGDQSEFVRDATASAARAVMGQLSAQGVKLVLPAIMEGLEDKAWRTKQGSVRMLGAMSACAPKQLGACLPQIVPRLSETLVDTHPKVVDAATEALKAVGEVIRNPEIRGLSPALLGAIAKPAELTQRCLDVLLEMTFVNVVDAPSLALIVPILSRGLRDRKADLKKKAAKIAGNMCSLVADPKDMDPYVPILLPDIRKSLTDPSPEVRAVSAAALASLLRGMGGADANEHFADVVPWLVATLQSDGPMTERSGAAQGLAECLAVLGEATFEEMLPEIFAGCSHAAAHVREGHLTLLRFLPLALGRAFEAHLKEALAEVLRGLADATEPVRDAALSAGRVFVEEFSHSARSLDLLLPSIEDGIASENWRIRQSAAELLGSMMFRIAGASGKVRVEGGSDDEGISTEAQGRALTETLGEERHHDLLAAVYALRSDATLVVRQAAVHVWKTVVANTPRTLRLVLPRLMRRLIASLSAESDERRGTASRCLGELVRKLGERVLPEVFPILRDGLGSDAAATREGVCLGLAEVLAAARTEQLEEYLSDVVPVIRDALCDESETVRNAAGGAFDAMFRHGGADVASDIVPELLDKLDDDPVALEGLKQVLRAQPKILASVLPKLATPPIDARAAATLGALAEVAGPALPPHLEVLFPPLLLAMGSGSEANRVAAADAASAVLRAVPADAHYLLLPEVLGGLDSDVSATRASAAKLCAVFAAEAPCYDEDDDAPRLISGLMDLFADDDAETVRAAWDALSVVTGKIAKEDQAHYVRDVRAAVDTAREKMRRKNRGVALKDVQVPGLCLPKGLAPIAQVYLQGVLQGKNADARECAAEGLREAALSTTTDAIKPHVIPITGPLIRILGDKYPGSVKSAILGALRVMIEKGGVALKPFVPQLQTTFVKCLGDPGARPVRQRAARALGRLMALQPRVDPLVNDLLTSLEAATDAGVKEAHLRAVSGALAYAGKNVKPETVSRAAAVARVQLDDAGEDGHARTAAAVTLARLAVWLPDEDRAALIDSLGGADESSGGSTARDEEETGASREGRFLALSAFARASPELALASHAGATLNGLARAAKDAERVGSRCAAARGMVRLAVAEAAQKGANSAYVPKILAAVAKLLRDDEASAREAAANALRRLCGEHPEAVAPHLAAFLPQLADVLSGDKSKEARYHADRCVRSSLYIVDDPAGLDFASAALKPSGAAGAARGKLTDGVLRRLKGLPEDDVEGWGEPEPGTWGSLAPDPDDDDEEVFGD